MQQQRRPDDQANVYPPAPGRGRYDYPPQQEYASGGRGYAEPPPTGYPAAYAPRDTRDPYARESQRPTYGAAPPVAYPPTEEAQVPYIPPIATDPSMRLERYAYTPDGRPYYDMQTRRHLPMPGASETPRYDPAAVPPPPRTEGHYSGTYASTGAPQAYWPPTGHEYR